MNKTDILYERAQYLFQQMTKRFQDAGIPIPSDKINRNLRLSRATAKMGSCKKQNDRYTISLSVYILEDEESVRNTLAHELVHTCEGCMNHGAGFQRIGKMVEERLGIPVNRTATKEESERSGIKDVYRMKAGYRVRCENCGAVIYRQRKSALIKHPERYRCGNCGGRWIAEERG